MSRVDLSPIDSCFQGAVPSLVATCSTDGIPNIVYVSHVHRVDHEHVAISDQFMRRTSANLQANGAGEAIVCDPSTGAQHRLTLAFVRRDTEGSVVEKIRARIEGIAEATGMKGTFGVRAALVCRVTAVEEVEGPSEGTGTKSTPIIGLSHVGELAEQLHATEDLRSLISVLLNTLADRFGFPHPILLLPDETGDTLFTVDSHGYPASGVGSEVRVGEGLLGQCARLRQSMRVLSLSRERRYSRAAAATSVEDIPLPGLPNAESLLAVPLSFRDQLVGLLIIESPEAMAFSHDDEVALSIVARLAAPQLWRAQIEAKDDAPVAPAPDLPRAAPAPIAVRYYEENDSVFVNDEYLVKGVAGRILWIVLRDHADHGRRSFSNRELRLDPRLELSALKDNLEARMLLLRRRLEESGLGLRLPVTARGRFALECDGPVILEKVATGRR